MRLEVVTGVGGESFEICSTWEGQMTYLEGEFAWETGG